MTRLTTTNGQVDEPIEKRELEKAISEKEKKLNELIENIEQLKIDLITVKQEYDVRVGRLYLKLDELDLEILKFKKIKALINKGFSLEDAQKIVEETLKKNANKLKKNIKN